MSRRFLSGAIALSLGLTGCQQLATNADFNEGVRQQQASNYAAAHTAYSQALARDPQLDQAYYRRGQVAQQLGNHAGAIADFQAALKLNPKLVDAYYRQGLSEFARQHWAQAEHAFSKTIELYYDDGEAYFQRGRSRAAQEKFDGALSDLTFASVIYLRQNDLQKTQQAQAEVKKVFQAFTELCARQVRLANQRHN
jgi:tetratricopeptide (TPR) repeat protein